MHRLLRFVLAMLAVPLLCWPTPSPAGERVTVVLVSGQRLEQVEYKVLTALHAIELRGDGKKQVVSENDVKAVLDAQGNDITDRVLGAAGRGTGEDIFGTEDRGGTGRRVAAGDRAIGTQGGSPGAGDQPVPADTAGGQERASVRPRAPGEETWVSRSSEEWKRATRMPWHVVVALYPVMSLPFGDYYDGINSGAGAGTVLHIGLTPEVALHLNAELLGLSASNNVPVYAPSPFVVVRQDNDINAWRFVGGIEYYQPLGQPDGPATWFVHDSIGVIRHDLRSRITLRDATSGETATGEAQDHPSRFTMTLGAGIIYRFTPRVGLQAGGDLDGVWATATDSNGNSSTGLRGWVFSMHCGLAIIG